MHGCRVINRVSVLSCVMMPRGVSLGAAVRSVPGSRTNSRWMRCDVVRLGDIHYTYMSIFEYNLKNIDFTCGRLAVTVGQLFLTGETYGTAFAHKETYHTILPKKGDGGVCLCLFVHGSNEIICFFLPTDNDSETRPSFFLLERNIVLCKCQGHIVRVRCL